MNITPEPFNSDNIQVGADVFIIFLLLLFLLGFFGDNNGTDL